MYVTEGSDFDWGFCMVHFIWDTRLGNVNSPFSGEGVGGQMVRESKNNQPMLTY